jgi:CRP/FNR family cyclic AMP-dependent transcriptional regulator
MPSAGHGPRVYLQSPTAPSAVDTALDLREINACFRPEWPESSFLAGIADDVMSDFLLSGVIVRFSPRELLMEEGGRGTEVYLLLSACTKVTARLDRGGDALMAVRVSGDIVGELAVAADGERVATVRVCGRDAAVCICLGAEEFARLLHRHPEASLRLTAAVSRKLRTATRRRVDYTGCAPHVRLARALLELADDYGQAISRTGVMVSVNLTQVELGTLVGVSEITAQRALRALRDDGLVVTDGRRPIVRDVAALRTLAYPS